MLVLQECVDLEKHVLVPSSDTYQTSSHKANQDMHVKVEEVSDVKVEEKCPVSIIFTGITSEHEVR
jgi:hypothetical protein